MGTLLLLDANTLAGWRRPSPSLAQLHHAVLHLERARPDDRVAVIADPAGPRGWFYDFGAGRMPKFLEDLTQRDRS